MAKEVISTYDAFLLGLRTRPLNIGVSMRVGKYIIEAMQNAIPNFSPEHYTFSELTLAEREMGVLNHSVDLAFSRLPVTAGLISYFVIRRDPIPKRTLSQKMITGGFHKQWILKRMKL